MKIRLYRYIFFTITCSLLLLSCSNDIEQALNDNINKAQGAEAYISIENYSLFGTRSTANNYDQHGVGGFARGDKVGLYATKGLELTNQPGSFNDPVVNGVMYFEGISGSSYKFSNADLVIDSYTVSSNTSLMYYPYYDNMPTPYQSNSNNIDTQGLWLRSMDTDGIEKCVDFMATYTWPYNTAFAQYDGDYRVHLSNGLLAPDFYHACSSIGIQRGEGFSNPKDPRIWVVMRNPFTDIRIYQYSASSNYFLRFQYNPGGEEVMQPIIADIDSPKVNKYRVWQAWKGNPYNNNETYYTIVPPGYVSYILIQDDYGHWQSVTDFYLFGNDSPNDKVANCGRRYILTVKLEGVNPVVRPVLIEGWDRLTSVTDERKVGMETLDEFFEWIAQYNLYVSQNRPESMKEKLVKYGSAVKTGNETKWTFYINSDLELPGNGKYRIDILEDELIGASEYRNYSISNIKTTLIGEMRGNASIENLSFRDMYVISKNSGEAGIGGLVNKITNGIIKNINIHNGILVTDTFAGILAGEMQAGSITDSTFSGDVIGQATVEEFNGIVGKLDLGVTLNNNDYSGLNFVYFQ